MSQYPKKNPLSMQLDLSKFTLATEDEKKILLEHIKQHKKMLEDETKK